MQADGNPIEAGEKQPLPPLAGQLRGQTSEQEGKGRKGNQGMSDTAVDLEEGDSVTVKKVEEYVGVRKNGTRYDRQRSNATLALGEEGLGNQGAGDSVCDRIHNLALSKKVGSEALPPTPGISGDGR